MCFLSLPSSISVIFRFLSALMCGRFKQLFQYVFIELHS